MDQKAFNVKFNRVKKIKGFKEKYDKGLGLILGLFIQERALFNRLTDIHGQLKLIFSDLKDEAEKEAGKK